MTGHVADQLIVLKYLHLSEFKGFLEIVTFA